MIEIEGKSAHAAAPHLGVDALAIAVRLYTAIMYMCNSEVNPKENFICSVNKLEAGTANNVVAAKAVMKGTIRTFNLELSQFFFDRIVKIAKSLSEETGAEIKATGPLKSACVYNNPYVTELLRHTAQKVVGTENVKATERRYGSEDFSLFGQVKPAVMLRLGVQNEEKGFVNKVHQKNFDLDEDAMSIGASTFVQFVVDHQNGIDMKKAVASDERN